MMKAKALIGITVMALMGCQSGPKLDTSGADITVALPEISGATLKRHVETLSSDDFEGRAPGTAGGLKTRSYLVSEMERLGLEPIGDSFEHPVTLVSREVQPASSRARFSYRGRPDQLTYKSDAVYWSKRDDERLSIQDSEVVFVGHGVVAPEYGWNDYAGIDVRGKTVVMLINDPGFRKRGRAFKGEAMTYYGRWTYKFEEAARQGAEAALIIHQDEPASYGWGVVEASWSGPQLDLPREAGAELPVKLEGWISLNQAQSLFRAAGLSFEEAERLAQSKDFSPISLSSVGFSAEIFQTFELGESANVAGVLPGVEAPDEYVLYTAHWDHLGVNEQAILEGKDGVYNGAVDNATGTGGILAIAESYVEAGIRPRRSQIFLAVTAEESGLLGSKAFASNPPVPLSKIVGGLNIDALLPTGKSKDLTVIGYGASELEDTLKAVAGREGMYLRPDPSPASGFFYRSDHIEFAKRGVPMLYLKNGLDLLKGGESAGRSLEEAYRAGPYHGVGDEIEETWQWDGMVQTLTILRDTGALIADSGDYPNWYEGSEFRKTRDAQRP